MALTDLQLSSLKTQIVIAFSDPTDYAISLSIINKCTDYTDCLNELNSMLPNGQGLIATAASLGQEQMQQQVAISLQKLGLASLVVTTRTLLGYDTLLTYSNNSFAAINELVQTVTALYPNGTSYNTTIAGDLYSLKSEYGYTIIQWHSVKL